MHDLRRRALERGEGHKTLSRKQRSRVDAGVTSTSSAAAAPVSPAGSAPSSRPASRLRLPADSRDHSRRGSDDDDLDSESDAASVALASVNDFVASVADLSLSSPAVALEARLDELLERKKGASRLSRVQTLAGLAYTLSHQYAFEEVSERIDELLPVLRRSAAANDDSDDESNEAIRALKALSALILTVASEDLYDELYEPLKLIITNSAHFPTKAQAIHTLSATVFFGGGTLTDVDDALEFLLDIVETDGSSVSALDRGQVVTAALEAWGFLATRAKFDSRTVQAPMTAFVDQLESSDPDVQISAGENIALLYEKSYVERGAAAEAHFNDHDNDESGDEAREDDITDSPNSANTSEDEGPGADSGLDDDVDDSASTASDDSATAAIHRRYIRVFTPWRDPKGLQFTLNSLSRLSNKSLAADTRRRLHSSFGDILHSVQYPTHGPRYSTARHRNSDRHLGSRLSVRLGPSTELRIDSWRKLAVVNACRRLLSGNGLAAHVAAGNRAVRNALPHGCLTEVRSSSSASLSALGDGRRGGVKGVGSPARRMAQMSQYD